MDLRRTTFLRFLAAFAIVVFHFGRDCPSLAWGERWWPVANSAVSFFYLLSGFILACVYGERERWAASDFYLARVGRILPAYLLATLPPAIWLWWNGGLATLELLLVTLLLQAWVPGHSQSVANAPAWSLSVEAFFYLLFPALCRVNERIRSARVLIAGMLFVWLANQYLHWRLLQPFVGGGGSAWLWDAAHHHPLGHLATFVAGMLGGRLYRLHGHRCRTAAPWLCAGSITALLVLTGTSPSWLHYHHNGLFTPLSFLLILGVATGSERWFGWLTARPLLVLGEISYGIYILQMPAHLIFRVLLGAIGWTPTPDAAFWTFAVFLSGVAWLSWRFVEAPARRWLTSR